jgi:uncharacterized protein (DUF885 family)
VSPRWAQAKRAEDTVYYKPFVKMPASIAPAEQAQLRAEAVKAINEQVIPAHAKLLTFLKNDYIPKRPACRSPPTACPTAKPFISRRSPNLPRST